MARHVNVPILPYMVVRSIRKGEERGGDERKGGGGLKTVSDYSYFHLDPSIAPVRVNRTKQHGGIAVPQ